MSSRRTDGNKFLSTADLPAMLASGQLDANQMMLASLGILLNSVFDIRIALGLHKGASSSSSLPIRR